MKNTLLGAGISLISTGCAFVAVELIYAGWFIGMGVLAICASFIAKAVDDHNTNIAKGPR